MTIGAEEGVSGNQGSRGLGLTNCSRNVDRINAVEPAQISLFASESDECKCVYVVIEKVLLDDKESQSEGESKKTGAEVLIRVYNQLNGLNCYMSGRHNTF
jgi:hypothetical protein